MADKSPHAEIFTLAVDHVEFGSLPDFWRDRFDGDYSAYPTAMPATFAPPIPRLMDTRAKEGAIAVEDAGLDLRADILLSLTDFTNRTGLKVKQLTVYTAEDGTYRLGIRVTIRTNR